MEALDGGNWNVEEAAEQLLDMGRFGRDLQAIYFALLTTYP